MPETGWFRADPYDVAAIDDEQTEVDFDRVLARIEKLPVDPPNGDPSASRWGAYFSSWMVIDNIKMGQPIHGTVFMAKNRDLALAGGPSGISPPRLKEDQGLGKHVAFLWDKTASVLWFQRDRNAVGLTAFRDYVMSRTGMSVAITPRLHPDALARVARLKYVKRIEMTFSRRTEGHDAAAPRGSTIKEFLDLRDRLDAATIEVKIKPSRGKVLGSGSRGLLRETADLLRQGFDGLRGAKVFGATEFNDEDEADWQTVDLLRDKMHFEVELPVSRFREPTALMAAIKRLWHEHHSDI